MRINFDINGKKWIANLKEGIDLSIPLRHGANNPNAWYAPPVDFSPVIVGDFVGSLESGSPVNFKNVRLNPHGNGTHTESLAHISKEGLAVFEALKETHFISRLVSLLPQKMENGDRVFQASSLEDIDLTGIDALILRTEPNDDQKKSIQYSGTNPPYLHPDFCKRLASEGIDHLLLDLPSVDREEDGGALAAHKAFWGVPDDLRLQATITEMIYVPNEVKDGIYLLNLQIPRFDLDAAPSRPIIFRIKES